MFIGWHDEAEAAQRRLRRRAGRNFPRPGRPDARAPARRARALGAVRPGPRGPPEPDRIGGLASAALAAEHAAGAHAPRRPDGLLRARRPAHRRPVRAGARARGRAGRWSCGGTEVEAMTPTPACTVCELHAESTFKIEGMDCREEVALIERRFRNLRGLEDFSADLVGQRLHVKYDAAKLTASAIAGAVADTGMRAWLEHEEPIASGDASFRRRQVAVAVSGVALGTALAAGAMGAEA